MPRLESPAHKKLVVTPLAKPASIFVDLRPLLAVLNRELLRLGAEPVRREELPEIDEVLAARAQGSPAQPDRCRRCEGFVCADIQGNQTCLNCGRAAVTSRHLEDLIQKIAIDLIEQRQRTAASEAHETSGS